MKLSKMMRKNQINLYLIIKLKACKINTANRRIIIIAHSYKIILAIQKHENKCINEEKQMLYKKMKIENHFLKNLMKI